MACSVKISTENNLFKEIYDKSGGNFTAALSLYSEIDKEDNALSSSTVSLSPNEKIKFILNSRLKNIDRLLKDKNQNKFKLEDEGKKFQDILDKLTATPELGQAYASIRNQLDLIRNEIEKPGVTIQQLENYFRMTNQYANLSKEIMDEVELLDENIEIEKESSELLKRINKKLMEQVKDIALQKGVTLTDKDLTRIEETNWANSRALDITADKNPFVQYVAKVVLEAAGKRDLTIKKRMDALEEKRKKLGANEKERLFQAQKILRHGKFNQLIDKYSSEYYDVVNGFWNDLRKAKKNGESTKDILKKRNIWYRDNTTAVDPQIFLSQSPQTKQAKTDELVAKVGNQERAEKLINLAEKKYKAYQEELKNYKEYLDADDTLDADQKKVLTNEFIVKNSPDVYYGIFHANMFDVYQKEYNITSVADYSYKYVVTAPLDKNEAGKDLGWYDSSYNSMQGDNNLYEYYKEVKIIMNEWKQYLPDYVKEDAKSENYIFRAKANLIESFNNNGLKGFWNQLDDNVKDGFSTEFQDEYVQEVDAEGKPVKNVPISALRNIDYEKARIQAKLDKDAANKDKGKPGLSETQLKVLKEKLKELETAYTIDPSKSIEVFLAMAANYKFMSEIQSEVEAANYIAQQAKQRNLDGTSDNARNVKERLQYFIDASLYNQRTDIEGQHKEGIDFKDNIFGSKDLVGGTSDKKKLALELAKKIQSQKDRADELFSKKENDTITPDEADELKNHMELIEEYRMLGGKRFTWSKLADRAIEWTALKTFGLNPFSPIANVTFGMIATYIEAQGGQHFNTSQATKAWGIMFNSTAKYLSFGGAATNQSTKITSIMEKFGVVEDSIDTKYGKNRLQESKTSKALNPYNWMKSTDFFMKGVSVIAIMQNPKNKFNKGLVTKENKPITLWEAFDINGKWKSELFSEEVNKEWDDSFIDGNGQKLLEFKNYLEQVEKSQHGNFNRNTPVMGKKNAIGRLVGQFRLSWMAEGFKSRFANKYYDSLLQEDVEGRYKTFQRLLSEREDLSSNYFKSVLGLLFRASKVEGLTELDKANLAKIKADLIFYTSFMMLMVLLKSWWDDDEDGKIDNGMGKIIYNQLTQAQSDISFYLSPQVFKTFTSNLIPSLNIYTDLAKASRATVKYLKTGEEDDEDRMWKNIMKNFPFTRSIIATETKSTELIENYIER